MNSLFKAFYITLKLIIMYTTTSACAINATYIPQGAQVIRNEEFMWRQMMNAIKILSGRMPVNVGEIMYMVDDHKYWAILDEQHNLVIWTI